MKTLGFSSVILGWASFWNRTVKYTSYMLLLAFIFPFFIHVITALICCSLRLALYPQRRRHSIGWGYTVPILPVVGFSGFTCPAVAYLYFCNHRNSSEIIKCIMEAFFCLDRQFCCLERRFYYTDHHQTLLLAFFWSKRNSF